LNLKNTSSREDVFALLRKHAGGVNDGNWILAVHYDANRFEDKRDITALELENACPGVPIVLRHASGHACVASSSALRLAGISKDTQNPEGGVIVRDESGEPTGLLQEDAMSLVYRVVPKPDKYQMRDAIKNAMRSMMSYGITCASDMMTGSYGLEEEFWAYEKAIEETGGFRCRLYIAWEYLFEKGDFDKRDFPGSEFLKVGGVKLYADGAIGAGTAAFYEPDLMGCEGILIHEPKDLERKILLAEGAGFSAAVHAIGERAVDVVLDALSKTKNPSKHRIEHAMALNDNSLRRIAEMQIPVVMQPEFLSAFHKTYFSRLKESVARKLKPLRSLIDGGARVALSSDRPIVDGNPWTGIYAASHREEFGFDPNENINMKEAAELYTKSGAIANGEKGRYGFLEPSAFADFQVYQERPIEKTMPPKNVYLNGNKIDALP
jgi:predicted amidohydrolase YtcJ